MHQATPTDARSTPAFASAGCDTGTGAEVTVVASPTSTADSEALLLPGPPLAAQAVPPHASAEVAVTRLCDATVAAAFELGSSGCIDQRVFGHGEAPASWAPHGTVPGPVAPGPPEFGGGAPQPEPGTGCRSSDFEAASLFDTAALAHELRAPLTEACAPHSSATCPQLNELKGRLAEACDMFPGEDSAVVSTSMSLAALHIFTAHACDASGFNDADKTARVPEEAHSFAVEALGMAQRAFEQLHLDGVAACHGSGAGTQSNHAPRRSEVDSDTASSLPKLLEARATRRLAEADAASAVITGHIAMALASIHRQEPDDPDGAHLELATVADILEDAAEDPSVRPELLAARLRHADTAVNLAEHAFTLDLDGGSLVADAHNVMARVLATCGTSAAVRARGLNHLSMEIETLRAVAPQSMDLAQALHDYAMALGRDHPMYLHTVSAHVEVCRAAHASCDPDECATLPLALRELCVACNRASLHRAAVLPGEEGVNLVFNVPAHACFEGLLGTLLDQVAMAYFCVNGTSAASASPMMLAAEKRALLRYGALAAAASGELATAAVAPLQYCRARVEAIDAMVAAAAETDAAPGP